MKRNLLAVLVSALALSACTDHQTQYPQQYAQPAPVQYAQPAPAPVVVQAAPQHSGGGDMLTGALLGGVAGHLLTKGNQPAPAAAAPAPVQTRVIERRTVVNNYITKTAPAAPVAPVAAKPAAAPSYRPTYTATPTYRPSAPASRPTVSLGKR